MPPWRLALDSSMFNHTRRLPFLRRNSLMESNSFFRGRRICPLAIAVLLLVGCKSNNSQQEPLYLDAEIEYPEYEEQPTEMTSDQKAEDWDDVIHIRYDKPVKGYTVTVDLSGDYAEMHFEKGSSSFTAEIDMFEEQLLYEEGVGEYNGKETVLPYVPLIFGKKITPEGTFGFFDVDFDGKDELVYAAYTQGYHGRTAFRVFELDGTERDDEPFDWNIDEVTEFNRSEKSITIFRDGDWDGGDVLKYRLQSDGAFHVTDSTHILYKHSEDIVTDSIRFHYRKQGNNMVLVKKEAVK